MGLVARLRAVRADRSPDEVCRCGHPYAAHQHYRRGSDCALCGCRRFVARPQ